MAWRNESPTTSIASERNYFSLRCNLACTGRFRRKWVLDARIELIMDDDRAVIDSRLITRHHGTPTPLYDKRANNAPPAVVLWQWHSNTVMNSLSIVQNNEWGNKHNGYQIMTGTMMSRCPYCPLSSICWPQCLRFLIQQIKFVLIGKPSSIDRKDV
jgi:hypothetical protein